MNWLATPKKHLLKLLISSKTLGFERLTASPDTYFLLEHKRDSHQLLLRSLLPSLDEDHILFADSNGEKPLKEELDTLFRAQQSNPSLDIQIIPVSIFHGRLPHKESSWLKQLFGEQWHPGHNLRKSLQVLVNGRETLIQADNALRLSDLLDIDAESSARKATRVLRTHFQIRRRAIIGPDLSHRNTLLADVMRHPQVQQTLEQHAEQRGENRLHVEQQGKKILEGIAADFNPAIARMLNNLVTVACRRLYRDVEVHNIAPVRDLALDHQLIYLPCHRSHMDYLLLSWVLYRQGLMLPHVAAGDNLNIPLIGPLLKRGGAIFMRRKFHGDQLYYALYKAYLEAMSHRGHALEYFIEGGRSRTGRLLPAKTGLLKMSVESFTATPQKPVAIVPVWIGYDKLVESSSYQHELAGQSKQSENLGNTLGAASILIKRFGKAHLSFGTPLPLAEVISPLEDPQQQAVQLGKRTLRAINGAAKLTPISLIATTLLNAPGISLSQQALEVQLTELKAMLGGLYPEILTQDLEQPVKRWITDALDLKQISADKSSIYMNSAQAQASTFYRNNILHLLALPGLYLLLARRLPGSPSQTFNRLLKELYPVLDAELTLPVTTDALTPYLRQARDQLREKGLLSENNRRWYANDCAPASLLAMTVEPILLRYYMVLRVLDRYREIAADDLLDVTRRLALRIHQEYGFHSREYAEPRVIQSFIDQALETGLITERDGRLCCLQNPQPLFKLARKVLRPHLIVRIDERLGSRG